MVVVTIISGCSIVATSATGSGTIKQLGVIKTTLEFASQHYTNKSATDHAVSFVLRKDCKVFRVTKREKICHEIKTKVFDDGNKNKMKVALGLIETGVVNFTQNYIDGKKKIHEIIINQEILKNNNEVLAHNILNNRNFDESNFDENILADNLSSIHSPLEKNFNKMKKFNNKNKNTKALGYVKSSVANSLTNNINKMKEFNNKNKNTNVLGYLKKRI